jgi:hypothetical protein
MKITLENPKELTIRPAQVKTISEITIDRMVDLPKQKKVIIFSKELGMVTLWEGESYDLIGQWTDLDVENKLIELYS